MVVDFAIELTKMGGHFFSWAPLMFLWKTQAEGSVSVSFSSLIYNIFVQT